VSDYRACMAGESESSNASPARRPWPDNVEAFLHRPLHAVLATRAPDGSISQSVVWYRLDGSTVWISCRPASTKARHVRVDPQVSLLVLAPHGGSYVRIEGSASVDELVSDEQRLALVGPYQGADARAWLAENPLPSPNTLMRIRPSRVVSRGV
jgi:PPOX class probable F420-dependent enzyme